MQKIVIIYTSMYFYAKGEMNVLMYHIVENSGDGKIMRISKLNAILIQQNQTTKFNMIK